MDCGFSIVKLIKNILSIDSFKRRLSDKIQNSKAFNISVFDKEETPVFNATIQSVENTMHNFLIKKIKINKKHYLSQYNTRIEIENLYIYIV